MNDEGLKGNGRTLGRGHQMSMDDPRQRHEIPTHLEVEDRILFGLTLRQGIILLLGATAGYFLFAQSGQAIADIHVPLAMRISLGLLPALVALAVALIQPGGRPVEDWLFAIAHFLTVPKQCVWYPRTLRAATPKLETEGETSHVQHTRQD
jgi:hypothetical protein